MTSNDQRRAAALWHMIYPQTNFYSTHSDTQRKWIRFAKESKKYFLKEIGEEHAARYF